VLDRVREVLQRAERDALLGRILRIRIRLSLVRQNHLGVGLGAKSARLEQGLREPHAARVDVHPGLHVVERVHHAVQRLPEGVVEGILRVRRHPDLQRPHLQASVHPLGGAGRRQRLRLADVWLPEQELSVQVRDLYPVHVCDRHLTALPAARAHHGEALQVLAPQGSCADQEEAHGAHLALEGAAEDGDLVVVPATQGLPIGNVAWW